MLVLHHCLLLTNIIHCNWFTILYVWLYHWLKNQCLQLLFEIELSTLISWEFASDNVTIALMHWIIMVTHSQKYAALHYNSPHVLKSSHVFQLSLFWAVLSCSIIAQKCSPKLFDTLIHCYVVCQMFDLPISQLYF